MTDERDAKVSAAYRELGAEEPPRRLDDAILAAARREAGARPAPLAPRGGRQRWFAPLATAAVLVLAVALTWNMQRERPGIESPAQQAAAPPPAADRDAEKAAAKQVEKEVAKPMPTDDLKTVRRKDAERPAAPAPSAAGEPKPFMADKPATAGAARSSELRGAAADVAGSLSQPLEERTARDAPAAARAPQAGPAPAAARMQAQKLADTPERELERIVELRVQGRHDEADKALAEFRKRHPDFKIPEAMRARVERR